jgi:hypothetical protein
MMAQVALAISFLSFCISALAFYRGSERAQNKRIKAERMCLVSTRSILVWEQIQTVIAAKKGEFSLDSYFFPSYQRNIHRLEDALDGAFAVGLFSDLIGTRENALTLHLAFLQSLTNMEGLNPQNSELDEWIKQHFLMGMVRLLDQCMGNRSCHFPKDLKANLLPKISGLQEEAWNYIQKPH